MPQSKERDITRSSHVFQSRNNKALGRFVPLSDWGDTLITLPATDRSSLLYLCSTLSLHVLFLTSHFFTSLVISFFFFCSSLYKKNFFFMTFYRSTTTTLMTLLILVAHGLLLGKTVVFLDVQRNSSCRIISVGAWVIEDIPICAVKAGLSHSNAVYHPAFYCFYSLLWALAHGLADWQKEYILVEGCSKRGHRQGSESTSNWAIAQVNTGILPNSR